MRWIVFAVGLLGGSIPSVCQQASNVEPVFGDEVVVTASLEEESERKLPASVDVIEAEEIEERQATELADLLATIPGLTVVRSGSPGQVTSLFSRGTESDHILVLWNGIELNNPYFGGFNWAFLPTEGVRRVEIVRGPFSAIHGSDAIGGVVQILSDSRQGGTVRLEVGDDGYSRGALAAGASADDFKIDVFGHFRRGEGESENDFYDSEEIVGRAEWNLGAGLSVGITARVNESDVGIPFSAGVPSPRRQIGWLESEVAVPFAADLGPWKINAQLSEARYESRFRDPEDAFGFTASDTESRARRLRAQFSHHFDRGAWLAFGGEIERLDVDDRSVFGVSLAGARQKTRSVFAEFLQPFGRISLDVGLRHDDNDVFGSKSSPRLGIVVDLDASSRLRASFGEGFRAPSLGELFFPFSGNAALEPEESKSFELGLEHATDSWELGLTGFENRLTNLIDFDFTTFTNVNVGSARTRGFEARLGFKSRQARLLANATVLDTVDQTTGLPLLRRPEETASLRVSIPRQSWSLHLTGLYVGPRDDVDPVTSMRAENSGYFRLDLAGQWRMKGPLMPYARVENLNDREYAEAVGFPAPGRTFIGGLMIGWE